MNNLAVQLTTPKVIFNGQELTIIKEPLLEDLLDQLPTYIRYSYTYERSPYVVLNSKVPQFTTTTDEGSLKISKNGVHWQITYEEPTYEDINIILECDAEFLRDAVLFMLEELKVLPTRLKDFKWIVNEKENSLV